MQALVLHFPLHMLAPGLLAHQAASSTAVDYLERRKVVGVVVEGDEAARSQQFQNVNSVLLKNHRTRELIAVSTRQVAGGWLTGGHVLTGGMD